jgi:hypothetical protein
MRVAARQRRSGLTCGQIVWVSDLHLSSQQQQQQQQLQEEEEEEEEEAVSHSETWLFVLRLQICVAHFACHV